MNIANIVVNQTTGVCTMRKRIPAGAVGLTVTVHFADPLWDQLEKTVVFRGRELEKIADRFDGTTAVIPAEVIAEPGTTLYFGIWGRDPEGILQLPLIEVRLGTTERATQPGSDPEADPTLPIWAKLQQDIEDLKKGGASDEQIAQAVEDYLEKNPIEGGYPTTTEISDESTDEEVPTAAAVRKYVGQHSGGNVDLTGVVKSVNGQTPDENGNVQIAVSSGGGWTTEQIDLLDSLLSNVSFNSENGGAIADMLIASLRSGASSGGGSGDSGGETEPDNPSVQTYTITRNLTGCTSSSSLSSVVGGVSHNETLTAADGYTLDGAIVTITMGDVDITATAYSNGVIDITSVTGNIVISAVMVNTGTPIYEISEPITYDGTEATAIDTGVAIWDIERDWTIVANLVNNSANLGFDVFMVPNPNNAYGNAMLKLQGRSNSAIRTFVNGTSSELGSIVWFAEKAGNTAKVVMTHTADSGKVVSAYHAVNIAGKVETGEGVETVPGDGWTNSASSLVIGSGSGGFTLNDLKIYKRVLTADEISAYLA